MGLKEMCKRKSWKCCPRPEVGNFQANVRLSLGKAVSDPSRSSPRRPRKDLNLHSWLAIGNLERDRVADNKVLIRKGHSENA